MILWNTLKHYISSRRFFPLVWCNRRQKVRICFSSSITFIRCMELGLSCLFYRQLILTFEINHIAIHELTTTHRTLVRCHRFYYNNIIPAWFSYSFCFSSLAHESDSRAKNVLTSGVFAGIFIIAHKDKPALTPYIKHVLYAKAIFQFPVCIVFVLGSRISIETW